MPERNPSFRAPRGIIHPLISILRVLVSDPGYPEALDFCAKDLSRPVQHEVCASISDSTPLFRALLLPLGVPSAFSVFPLCFFSLLFSNFHFLISGVCL